MTTSDSNNHCSKPKLTILDVGHGNSTVFNSEEDVIIMDAGPGTHLLSFLEHEEIHHIEYLLLSHAHKDHIAGAISLLDQKNITISEIMINPDQTNTDLWRDLIHQIEKRSDVELKPSLTTNDNDKFQFGEINIHIAAPSPYLALRGVGGHDRKDRFLSSNTLSVVFQIRIKGAIYVTLFADIDEVGFEYIVKDNDHLNSPIIVYPHHGGRGNINNPSAFAKQLCRLIKPKLVIFSIGRGQYLHPLPEIVSEVLLAIPDCWIACTQLSEHCSEEVNEEAEMITSILARGSSRHECCVGSIEIPLDGNISSIKPNRCSHQEFIKTNAETPMCKS